MRNLLRTLENRQFVAAPGEHLAGVWQARCEKLLPAMEAAAAWGSQCMVQCGDSSDAGETEESSSSSRHSIKAVGHTPKCEQLLQQQQMAPSVRHSPAAPPDSCPLGQLQCELAVGGIHCAHPACSNFEGASEAALPLQRCGGCRVVAYCR